ncbi:MAG TPA: hypothetical protein H9867_08660 [Candidatus Corynebacterium gallistercoris]|uniref:Low molecular weight antigen MTB12-like C-terminal domain-containing protein n=1 Tax=Candidatus Corynebacterium gallistercoris TaxID=2838530 RepID=A0A9D1RXV9_9CORY|nr:hypothetical protein [Candidatus Corynebacterium gallistercoris]
MRISKALAVSTALSATLALAACGNDEESTSSTSTSSATSSASQQAQPLPTALELSEVLNRAVDPGLPTEEKVDTVVGGEQAPDLFEALTQSKMESGAQLEVVDPVLPSLSPEHDASATVHLTLPEQEPQVISNVDFVNDNGTWKLDQVWACTLVNNVMPDRLPPMCHEVI